MAATLDRDEVLLLLDYDMQAYPTDSEDYQELMRIKQLILRAHPDDTIRIVSIIPKTRKH